MKHVRVEFDSFNKTWNVMLEGECIKYGTAFEVDEFLLENGDKYYE